MSTEEEKPKEHHGIMDALKDVGKKVEDVGKKVLDATVLDTHGKMIDGTVKLDGEFAKDVVNATILNTNPAGGNIGTYLLCHYYYY